MTKTLVIVESPAKAKTIGRILKSGYNVKATMGHVRDLPEKDLGVEPENGFAARYVVVRGKQKIINEIKAAAREAKTLYLATDPDREGEAISWHVVQAAKLDRMPIKRVVFHEITPEAVKEAFQNPREINMRLVNAQQARRILDRLVGYKISPILWRKVLKGLSAGRVQSVVVRMIVDREREIQNFVPTEYWTIEADLKKGDSIFRAGLVGIGKGKKVSIGTQSEAEALCTDLEKASFAVAEVKHKTVPRQPVAPFITSTLQQEAWRKLRFSAKRTMAAAQALYEGIAIGEGEEVVGLITYMRTDSTHVAPQAITETRKYIVEAFGESYLPPSPRIFKKKVKGAQEAHEAIRPTSIRREPASLKTYLTADQFKLYELIWKRMVASQMAAALYDSTTVDIHAQSPASRYLFRAASSQLSFPGFLALYSEGQDEEEDEQTERASLPALSKGDRLDLVKLFPEQHFTKPPPRYTEATLIKALEENGIGRPSTYAPILSTIQERDYVVKEKGQFKPTEMGCTVTDLLVDHFSEIVDTQFTARMEEKLDEISAGEIEWVPALKAFYDVFAAKVNEAYANMPKKKAPAEPTDEVCEKCGSPMVIKRGRYGRFMACSNFPACRNARPLRAELDIQCPRCGAKLVERRTKRKRIFYGCSRYPECDFATWGKPLTIPCPECGGMLIPTKGETAKCVKCQYEGSLEELKKRESVPA